MKISLLNLDIKITVRGKLCPATRENVKEVIRESYEQLFSSSTEITAAIGREPTPEELEAMEAVEDLDFTCL